ncbi:MAG: hypothetical protein IT566_15710 [Rhodospirillaceae bacterium]|nr:hypothetical protein [Rhodospirillaceae bacterium]
MAKFLGISAGIGFFISLVLLIIVSWYAAVLRSSLVDCWTMHTAINNEGTVCRNELGALRNELSRQLESSQREVQSLEARLESAGALRLCAANTSNMAG